MQIDTIFIDHTRQMVPPRVLHLITREDGQKAYIWANIGTVFNTEDLEFSTNPEMPKLPAINKIGFIWE